MFVREMRRAKAQSSPEESYDYFVAEQGLEALLDTLYDLTTLYPVWRTCLNSSSGRANSCFFFFFFFFHE